MTKQPHRRISVPLPDKLIRRLEKYELGERNELIEEAIEDYLDFLDEEDLKEQRQEERRLRREQRRASRTAFFQRFRQNSRRAAESLLPEWAYRLFMIGDWLIVIEHDQDLFPRSISK